MSQGRRHGGWVLATTLREAGIDTVFGLAGGHVMGFFDGCLSAGVRIVDTRHEQAAVHMAEGAALCTGRVAVAAVTAGPGVTNVATGIVNAQQTGAPVVVVCGGTSTELDHREAVQQIDASELYRTHAKWARVARDPARLAAYLKEAIHVASSGRPGVAVLQVPMNLQFDDAVEQEAWSPVFATPGPDPDAVARAVALLENAERPVVLAGGGAHWSRAGDALRAFTERTGIPVTTTSAARGLLSDTHPNCLGYLMHGGIAVTSADVVLILGSKFNANLVYGRAPLFMDGVKVVQVDVVPENIGGARAADVAIAGDASLTLSAMTGAWSAPRDKHDEHRAMAVQAAEMSRLQWRSNWEHAASRPIHPGRLAGDAVAAALDVCGEDVAFVADGGDSLVWALGAFPAYRPQGLHTSTSLGTLGVGVPFANAAAIAHGVPVVAVLGDGAFGLAAMEIDTAVRFDLPVVLCISNNAAWGDVRHEAENWFGKDRVVAADLRDSDYAAMARALGAHGERVEDAADLTAAVTRALRTQGPAVVDVKTDPEVVSDLLKEMAQLGLM